jgi:hypothetical protein
MKLGRMKCISYIIGITIQKHEIQIPEFEA